LNYAHKNQNNFNAIFVPAQLNERIRPVPQEVGPLIWGPLSRVIPGSMKIDGLFDLFGVVVRW
jgi:hypothetical protein